ncbi:MULTISPECIES: rRNA maturation RNase YbeY [unclassified Pseudactinotalea]|uniref:rRNA maturation RNase YbeY n=1 Tax=Micrococcales TaxID=85006 RepID=UPI003C7C39E7
MSTEVANESAHAVDESEFAALATFVLDEMHVHPQAELEVRFVDAEVMTELNERWMDATGATDVLAFPMDELRPGSPGTPSSEGILGSVVLCPQVAIDQARTAGHSADEEMLLLTTHGILHLLGYDHAEPEEEKEMFALQRRLLLTFLGSRPTVPGRSEQGS